jgi:hypothetical protein
MAPVQFKTVAGDAACTRLKDTAPAKYSLE